MSHQLLRQWGCVVIMCVVCGVWVWVWLTGDCDSVVGRTRHFNDFFFEYGLSGGRCVCVSVCVNEERACEKLVKKFIYHLFLSHTHTLSNRGHEGNTLGPDLGFFCTTT